MTETSANQGSRTQHRSNESWLFEILRIQIFWTKEDTYFLFRTLKHVEYGSKLLFTPRAKGFKGFLLLKWLSPNPAKRLIDWTWKSTSLGHAKHICCGVVTCFPLFLPQHQELGILCWYRIFSTQSSSHPDCSYVGRVHRTEAHNFAWNPIGPTWPTTLDRGPSDSEEHDFDQQDGFHHGWLFSWNRDQTKSKRCIWQSLLCADLRTHHQLQTPSLTFAMSVVISSFNSSMKRTTCKRSLQSTFLAFIGSTISECGIKLGKFGNVDIPTCSGGVGFDGHFFPSRKTSFRWHCTQGTEKTLKANPNQNWETSTILSDETLNHTNFYSASLYWSKPNRSFRRLWVARVRCESAIYGMIHQVSQVFHSYEEIIPKSYSQITDKYTATFLLQYHIFSSIIPC